MDHSKISYKALRFSLILIFVTALLLAVTQVVYAVLYTISTTDSSVSEWTSQGIPVFQQDASGDVGSPTEDILDSWVASGPSGGPAETVYFRMLVNASTALGENMAAAAAIDCDADGNFDEPSDRIIVHIPQCCNPLYGCEERNVKAWGDRTNYTGLGPDAGQRVGSDLEWSVPVADLPPDADHSVDCRNEVKILFYTADVSNLCTGGTGVTIIDQTPPSPWNGFRIPTVVTIKNLDARPASAYGIPAAIGLAIVSGMGLVALAWWRKE